MSAVATASESRPSFAFKRTRPEVAEHKDALLIEFAGFWMETEDEVVLVDVDPTPLQEIIMTAGPNNHNNNTTNTSTDDMEVDDAVSIITVDSATEEQVPQEQEQVVATCVETTNDNCYTEEAVHTGNDYQEPESNEEEMRSSFISTCWDIDNFMESVIPSLEDMEA
jgi:hypothetical protein